MCAQKMLLNKDAIGALKFISQRNRASHTRRVGHELQVVIASLTFFVVSAAAHLSKGFETDKSALFHPCVFIAFLFLCILASIYIKRSADSSGLNLGRARQAEGYIHEHLREKSVKLMDRKEPRPSKNRWIWEIIIIWEGAILSGFIIFEEWAGSLLFKVERGIPPLLFVLCTVILCGLLVFLLCKWLGYRSENSRK